jgi:V8-like Glu-specific endopeptidase
VFTKQSTIAGTLIGMCAAAMMLAPSSAQAAAGINVSDHKQAIDSGGTLDWPTGEMRQFDLSSGLVVNASSRADVGFDEVVRVPGAACLRLYFSDVRLEKGSLLRVTSLLDGQSQEMSASDLEMWRNTTAYFNGDAVQVEIVAAPFTTDNLVRMSDYAFEVGVADRGGCGICGNDDRVPSSDNNFARLSPVGCSATLYNEESCMVTAGHCLGQGGVVQFNVPASNSDGSTNNPPVADQFPVLAEQGVDGGVGADYGALRIGTNGSGQTPYDRYGTFMPLANSIPNSGNLEIRGYGVDENDPTRSQTQQFHDGPITTVGGTSISYDVDVTFGNSGSSIIFNGAIVGVVTHCSSGCENYGNRIDDPAFVQVRGIVCNGDEPPDGCPIGEIEDCNGNCCPSDWVGDGYCDDGSYQHNGVTIFLNCDAFNCDNGDCPAESCGDGGGGGSTGACCVGTECVDDLTSGDCDGFGGSYQGDDSSCNAVDCGGGGGGGDGDTCADAIDADLGGNAFDTTQSTDSGFGEPDASQCDGTFLDWTSSPDVWFSWSAPADGIASFSTCDASSFDTSLVLYRGGDCGSLEQVACNGDAADSSGCQEYHSQIDEVSVGSGELYYVRVGGWNAATGSGTLTIEGSFGKPQEGACCVGFECVTASESDCNVLGGEFQGTGSSCNSEDICGVEDCDGDADGDGQVDVNDLLGAIGEWGCSSGCSFDVTGDGQVNVSDVLVIIGSWGPCF